MSARKVELTKLDFKPYDFVSLKMTPEKQFVQYEFDNQEDVDILVKWKSTRPPKYNVEPNYTIVKSKTKFTFQLSCKNIVKEYNVPADRFSAVIYAIKPTNHKPKAIWRTREILDDLRIGSRHKKNVYIVFEGVNEANWWNKSILDEQERNDPTFVIDDEECEHDQLKTALLAGHFTIVHVPIQQSNEIPE
ncbi:hypothetical protein GCK72_004989 [Caenorhabditis remanei]|uniref:MSP domain-containing protein n=1 Tax=Caenorhabditis remanei TaxID=31234 RepID=A0A6A5HB87_CAERE|nr:hypothetical protein GCK72_004989 [Caenorhabditis remanei]KAF1765038.1 hypothetical protein GCK72_004989 [Caenorhabditis remanei]